MTDRTYFSNCYQCEKPSYECNCEMCEDCLEMISSNRGHICLLCGMETDPITCFENLGRCKQCQDK